LLRRAVAGFRACLDLPDLSADLHADARHNLELAQMLWLKARAANPNDPPDGGEDRPPDNKLKKPNGLDKDNNGKDDPGPRSKSDQTKQDGNKGSGAAGNGNKDKVKAGALQVLPDADQVVPLPPEETDAHLDSIIERIVQERRSHWQKSAQAPKDARNW
jgi:hypothetical protein